MTVMMEFEYRVVTFGRQVSREESRRALADAAEHDAVSYTHLDVDKRQADDQTDDHRSQRNDREIDVLEAEQACGGERRNGHEERQLRRHHPIDPAEQAGRDRRARAGHARDEGCLLYTSRCV